MITATGIRRPDNVLPLGTKVRYHHRASEMRLLPKTDYPIDLPRQWAPTGVGRAEPRFSPEAFDDPLSTLMSWFHAPAGVNKTFALWPEQGRGVVIALIRRGIGRSVAGYQSGGNWASEPEWEPGYFDAKEWVWLYVVKHTMSGLLDDVALVPMDAIERRRR